MVDTGACGGGVPPGMRKEFQYRRRLSEMLVSDLAKEAWHGRRLEDKDVVDPGDRRDGGPVGADFGVWVLICQGTTGVLPTRPVGPSV